MALNNGINVRLEPAIRSRLEKLSSRYGVKSSVLIRLAVSEKIESLEKGGPLMLHPKNAASDIVDGLISDSVEGQAGGGQKRSA
jgi:hypothetical protein